MRRLGLFIVVCLAVVAPASAGIRTVGKWALVIGNADYEDIVKLRYTVADAQLMYEVLSAAGYEVERLFDTTYCEIITSLLRLAQKVAEEPAKERTVVIYYSGHGAWTEDLNGDEEDGFDGAIVPVDYDLSEDFPLITDDLLDLLLSQFGSARVVVILDCGSIGARSLAAPGRLVLAGSPEDECVLEKPSLGHGVFTYYLVEGLRKGDRDGDGVISLQEAFAYAKEKIAELKEREPSLPLPEMVDGIGEPLVLFEDPSACPHAVPLGGIGRRCGGKIAGVEGRNNARGVARLNGLFGRGFVRVPLPSRPPADRRRRDPRYRLPGRGAPRRRRSIRGVAPRWQNLR
ncbi:MAG: hypothetical protein DRN68_05860 [Thaumarchaeota archaeon]|nr:MAG: hypothetical protein DRN68_05860 [Nitrososphaerota archaeon]